MVIRIVGTMGNDTLAVTSSVAASLAGRLGNDTLSGGYGDDRLFGGAGNDVLYATVGADTLFGGTGNDTYIVQAPIGAGLGSVDFTLSEAAGGGNDLLILRVSYASYTLPQFVEQIQIEADMLTLIGNASNNVIDASSRQIGMTINALAGRDSVIGTFANDTIDGGTGVDTMAGGSGNDVYYVDQTLDVVREIAGGGMDLVTASASYTLRAWVENLTLTGTATSGRGNASDNILTGNAYDNRLIGGGGNDDLTGGGGSDTLKGGSGDDVLTGGVGRDHLYGGAGSDAFVFTSADVAGQTRATADVIHDFDAFDIIDLAYVDANSNLASDQAFDFIGAAAFNHTAGQLRYDGDFLLGDTNGDGAADIFIAVQGSLAAISDSLLA